MLSAAYHRSKTDAITDHSADTFSGNVALSASELLQNYIERFERETCDFESASTRCDSLWEESEGNSHDLHIESVDQWDVYTVGSAAETQRGPDVGSQSLAPVGRSRWRRSESESSTISDQLSVFNWQTAEIRDFHASGNPSDRGRRVSSIWRTNDNDVTLCCNGERLQAATQVQPCQRVYQPSSLDYLANQITSEDDNEDRSRSPGELPIFFVTEPLSPSPVSWMADDTELTLNANDPSAWRLRERIRLAASGYRGHILTSTEKTDIRDKLARLQYGGGLETRSSKLADKQAGEPAVGSKLAAVAHANDWCATLMRSDGHAKGGISGAAETVATSCHRPSTDRLSGLMRSAMRFLPSTRQP